MNSSPLHLVSTGRVPKQYRMPPSLQRKRDINKLPSVVAKQLLQLAKEAYKRLCKKTIIFTDLGEGFEPLGTMKKTTSVNVSVGPECSYSFLHLTLQEYLAALHIAIVNPSGCKLVEWLNEGSVVVRFLAGMYRHDAYHSHPVYQELVRRLATQSLQLVHCAYECPSIMNSVKVDYEKRDTRTIKLAPEVGFDWYAIGYCVSHFNEKWGLVINDNNVGVDGIELLVKGLESSSCAHGKIQFLHLSSSSLSFTKVVDPIKEFCTLHRLEVFADLQSNDEGILQQLIAPGSELRRLEYYGKVCTNTLVPLLFQLSPLQDLRLDLGYQEINTISYFNENLTKLTISRNLLHLIVNALTSLTYVKIRNPLDSDLPVLTNIVKSVGTLKVLRIGQITQPKNSSISTEDELVELIKAAENRRPQLNKLTLWEGDLNKLPQQFVQENAHLLKTYP